MNTTHLTALASLPGLLLLSCTTQTTTPDQKPTEPNKPQTTKQQPATTPVSPDMLVVKGKVVGTPPASKLKVVLFWAAKKHLYVGAQTDLADDGTFTLQVARKTIANDALYVSTDTFSLGVAALGLLPKSTPTPKGMHPEPKAFIKQVVGSARSHALIYRKGSVNSLPKARIAWPDEFKDGEVSCGVGKRTPEPDFEPFAPTPCDAIPIYLGRFSWINWT